MQRKTWIDILKGFGIICVVIGHSTTEEPYLNLNSFIYSFHMPLFFLISGFLFSPKPLKKYLYRPSLRLLIPYITFTFILTLPDFLIWLRDSYQYDEFSVLRFIEGQVYSSMYYLKWYTVLWFISVLWMSSNAFNLIYNRVNWIIGLPLLIIMAYLFTNIPGPLPFRVRVVPMAMVYLWIGFLISQKFNSKIEELSRIFGYKWIIGFGLIILSLFIIWAPFLRQDMKHADYGIPIISIVIAVLISIMLAFLALILSRYKFVSKILCVLGEASMVIMILHLPVRDILSTKINIFGYLPTAIIVGLTVPVLIYLLMDRFEITKKLFLGKIVKK